MHPSCLSVPFHLSCHMCVICRVSSANQYTKLVAPLAWRACETFIPRKSAGTIVLEASDVFMLGCTFIEVLTGCSREPYDWLMEEDPSGMTLITYRNHESTRSSNPLVVRLVGVKQGGSRCKVSHT